MDTLSDKMGFNLSRWGRVGAYFGLKFEGKKMFRAILGTNIYFY